MQLLPVTTTFFLFLSRRTTKFQFDFRFLLNFIAFQNEATFRLDIEKEISWFDYSIFMFYFDSGSGCVQKTQNKIWATLKIAERGLSVYIDEYLRLVLLACTWRGKTWKDSCCRLFSFAFDTSQERAKAAPVRRLALDDPGAVLVPLRARLWRACRVSRS